MRRRYLAQRAGRLRPRVARAVLVLLIVLPLSSRAELPIGAERLEDATKKIGVADARFVLAFLRGDGKTLGDLYDGDALLLPPEHPIIRGRKSIDDFWKDGGFRPQSARLGTDSLEVKGDFAVETGSIEMITRDEVPHALTLKYLTVWKRQEDDLWKMYRHIWNVWSYEPAGEWDQRRDSTPARSQRTLE